MLEDAAAEDEGANDLGKCGTQAESQLQDFKAQASEGDRHDNLERLQALQTEVLLRLQETFEGDQDDE